MQKLTFAERRTGRDRRQQRRRSIKRTLREFWKPSAHRRHHLRRAPYVRRETYTVYLPDRV